MRLRPIAAFAYKQGFPLFTLSTLALFALLLKQALQPSAISHSGGVAAQHDRAAA